jgi:hypothetical protein
MRGVWSANGVRQRRSSSCLNGSLGRRNAVTGDMPVHAVRRTPSARAIRARRVPRRSFDRLRCCSTSDASSAAASSQHGHSGHEQNRGGRPTSRRRLAGEPAGTSASLASLALSMRGGGVEQGSATGLVLSCGTFLGASAGAANCGGNSAASFITTGHGADAQGHGRDGPSRLSARAKSVTPGVAGSVLGVRLAALATTLEQQRTSESSPCETWRGMRRGNRRRGDLAQLVARALGLTRSENERCLGLRVGLDARSFSRHPARRDLL